MAEGSNKHDRLLVSNTVTSLIDDSGFLVFDGVTMFEEMKQKMVIVEMFQAISTSICFALGSFMLIITLSSNIKDSMWELGVLRSMGSTKEQISRILCYEMVSNTLSAMTLGYSSGIIVSLLAIS